MQAAKYFSSSVLKFVIQLRSRDGCSPPQMLKLINSVHRSMISVWYVCASLGRLNSMGCVLINAPAFWSVPSAARMSKATLVTTCRREVSDFLPFYFRDG